jgi:hypothetical protein
VAEPERTEASRRRRIGCLALLVAAAAVIGGGVWLGLREDAGQTPCERYTHAAERALANCHSGYQDHPWLLAQCEEAIEVDDGCLERLKALSCEAIERNPAVVLDVCRKKP